MAIPRRNFNRLRIFSTFILITLSGCSGNLYTVATASEGCGEKRKAYEGIVAYPPANFVEISWLTAVLDEKNKIVRTHTGDKPENKCQLRLQYKQVIRPDYENPYQLVYKPGFLEKYIFKAEFEQGILKSVGLDSSPDRGETFKSLATAAGEAAKAVIAGLAHDKFACTHEQILKYIKRLKEVCPDDVCNFERYEPRDAEEGKKPSLPKM